MNTKNTKGAIAKIVWGDNKALKGKIPIGFG